MPEPMTKFKKKWLFRSLDAVRRLRVLDSIVIDVICRNIIANFIIEYNGNINTFEVERLLNEHRNVFKA